MCSLPDKRLDFINCKNFKNIYNLLLSKTNFAELFKNICSYFFSIDCYFGVSGGCAINEIDYYSDIDFVILINKKRDLNKEIKNISRWFSKSFNCLSFYEADHLDIDKKIFVIYFEVNGNIVKIDIELLSVRNIETINRPQKILVLYDPNNYFDLMIKKIEKLDIDKIMIKFSGWMWYTYTKIIRGEYFQAARALDFSRENALLPYLRILYKFPIYDGHRKIEQLFPKRIIAKLKKTYPSSLNKRELLKRFNYLNSFFISVYSSLNHKKQSLILKFDIIRQIIDKHV